MGDGGRPASGAERLVAGSGGVDLVLVVLLRRKIAGFGWAGSAEGIQTENPPQDAGLDGPESGQLAGEQGQGVEGGRSDREGGRK